MKIFLFIDGWVGLKVASYLKKNNETIVGIVIHPNKVQHFTKEIIEVCELPPERVFKWGTISEQNLKKEIINLNADIAFTIFWGYILKPCIYDLFKHGCINFHCSYLPFNRGKNPNVWPLIENTPAGITLHYIDEGIDTGPIIAQQIVKVEPIDTAKDLYEKLIQAFPSLFFKTWPLIKSGKSISINQDSKKSTFHLAKDFKNLDTLDLEKKYYPLDLINILRARTFNPHRQCYIYIDGRKVGIRIELEYID